MADNGKIVAYKTVTGYFSNWVPPEVPGTEESMIGAINSPIDEDINMLLVEGWQPLGDLKMATSPEGHLVYAQAMVKYAAI